VGHALMPERSGVRVHYEKTAAEGDPFVVCSTRWHVHSNLELELDHRRFKRAAGKRGDELTPITALSRCR
jgi:hypothetical protein